MGDTGDAHNILVIEDEDNIAIALDYLLTREGYCPTRIATGAGAVDLIRRTRPDLVLLDVMLPEVSGYEICQSVRSDAALCGVKILMMTARGSAMERRKGVAMGADGFISKPFELKALRAEVARILADAAAAAGGGGAGDGTGGRRPDMGGADMHRGDGPGSERPGGDRSGPRDARGPSDADGFSHG